MLHLLHQYLSLLQHLVLKLLRLHQEQHLVQPLLLHLLLGLKLLLPVILLLGLVQHQ
jgi:hypothetical protein